MLKKIWVQKQIENIYLKYLGKKNKKKCKIHDNV